MTNRKSKSAHAMVTLMKIWTKTLHILYVFRNNVVQISYRKKRMILIVFVDSITKQSKCKRHENF